MNPLTGWKMAASFVFVAAIAVLFGYSGRAEHRVLTAPAAVVQPAAPADGAAKSDSNPASNEIPDFQQLD
ncbi:MAG TPA: hypothetical protein VEP66_03595 [Myxococcales bacterium]|nr:hypothetical protein [Myxococcales bacterium]